MTEILPIQRETRSNQSFIVLMKKIILLGKNTRMSCVKFDEILSSLTNKEL